ncbi:MAG: hypothetical protein ACTS27_02075, partial [Phycisphaerales bacterium]
MGSLPRCLRAPTLLAMAALAGHAPAQPEIPTEVAQRVVHAFDFEEQEFNAEDVPQYWIRAQNAPPSRMRPGFPPWNKAGFDQTKATSGEYSVRAPIDGGSVSLRLAPGVIAAIPGADYVVSGRIITTGLSRAGARLVARFLDERLNPIDGAEVASEVVRTDQEWVEVRSELRGVHEDAAWIQIDLEVLQPQELEIARRRELGHEEPDPDDPVYSNRVWLEEVTGAAWFDDVIVYQLPRVELGTESPANVVVAPDTPSVVARIRDLTNESLNADLKVYDLDGRLIASMRDTLPPGGMTVRWTPELPGYGWNRAVLELRSPEGALVARSSSDFLWTPPVLPGRAAESRRFTLIAEDIPREQFETAPELMRRIGVGSANLAVLDRSITSTEVRSFARRIDPVVQALLDRGIDLTFTVTGVPDELAEILQIDVREPMELLGWVTPFGAIPPWTLYLNAILDRFGQRVARWQVGRTGEANPFWRPHLGNELDTVKKELSRLVPSVEVAVPWRAEQAIDDRIAGKGAITVTLPVSIPLDAIGQYIAYWGARVESTVVIETPDQSVYGRRAAVIELVKRAAAAWRADAQRIGIEADWSPNERYGSPAPDCTLAVWRQLVERLGGRRIVAELPVGEGMTALILRSDIAGSRQGALLAWNDSAPPERAMIRTYLAGEPVRVVDPFGNTATVGLV